MDKCLTFMSVIYCTTQEMMVVGMLTQRNRLFPRGIKVPQRAFGIADLGFPIDRAQPSEK